MTAWLRSFGRFWYQFLAGDDWVLAAGAAGALGLTFLLSRSAGSAWCVVPIAIAVLLPVSLWRAIRRR